MIRSGRNSSTLRLFAVGYRAFGESGLCSFYSTRTNFIFSLQTTAPQASLRNTQASILLAILVHAFNNTSTGMLDAIFPADPLSSTIPLMTGIGVAAVGLIVLTRGRLDYGRLVEARSAR